MNSLVQVLKALDALWNRATEAFERIREAYPDLVRCKRGCDDCCHGVFDLSPVEVLGVGVGFAHLPRADRRELLRRAGAVARAFDELVGRAGRLEPERALELVSQARIRCALLETDGCALYQWRPVTCRLYGVPVAIAGASRVCHLSGFVRGENYPAVDLAKFQNELEELSILACRLMPALGPVRLDMGRALRWAADHRLALARLGRRG